jgi:putative membrane protein
VDQAQRIHRGEHRSPFVRVMADPLRLIHPTTLMRVIVRGQYRPRRYRQLAMTTCCLRSHSLAFMLCFNMNFISSFLLRWALTTLPLWVASYIFRGVTFDSVETLIISGLLLGLVNAVIKPLIVILTLPITVLTLGLFIIAINTGILFLVQGLVPGFRIDSLGTGVLLALFISVFSFAANRLIKP